MSEKLLNETKMDDTYFNDDYWEKTRKKLQEEVNEIAEKNLKDPEFHKFVNECLEKLKNEDLLSDKNEEIDLKTQINMELEKRNLPDTNENILKIFFEIREKRPKENRQGRLRSSILKYSQNYLNGYKLYECLADFLEEFYRVDKLTREEMLAERPLNVEPKHEMVFLGAMAHKLAVDYDIKPPAWVFESVFYLSDDESYYEMDYDEEFKTYFRENAPYEFKIRNFFCTSDCLIRV